MVFGILNAMVLTMIVSKFLPPLILIAVTCVRAEKVEECTCSQVKACRQQARDQLFEKCLTQCKVSELLKTQQP